MRDEVDEFLKRVAQLRAQAEAQAKGQQPGKPPAQRPPKPPKPAAQPQSSPRPAPVPSIASPLEAEVVEAELAQTGDNIGRHVAEHLRGPEQIAAHTRQLGHEVDLADDKLEARLHEVFDHDLGRLQKTASTSAAKARDRAGPEVTVFELAQLLRSPGALRDAIIMAEVLRRPEERW